ncbi:MAG: (2Fe-2S) ferredoxin domain-containing protein [Actinomycetota bacterium]
MAGKKFVRTGGGAGPHCVEVALCVGSDCRDDEGFRELRRALGDHPAAAEVKCIGACEGPVVVVEPRGVTPVVLERIRTEKRRRDLVDAVTGHGELTPRLLKRRVTSKRAPKIIARTRRRLRAA